MTGELSPLHWMVVLGVFVVLFGAKRLPDAARGLGRSLRILKAELGAVDAPPAALADAAPGGSAPTVVGPPAATVAPPSATA